MKKIFLLLSVFSFLYLPLSFGQSNATKTLLQKVSSNLKNAGAISADFQISVSSNSAKVAPQKGHFLMKGKQYKIDLTGGQQIYCNGKTIWTYFPANKEVQVANYNYEEDVLSPAKLLSGSYETEYNYKSAGNKTIDGKTVAVVTLTPKKTDEDFKKLNLYIDKAQNMIVGGQAITNTNGTITYKVTNLKKNQQIANSAFEFSTKQHPGTEVVDLRF